METSQFQPTDKYRGGFYFEGNPFGRYLHVMTIKEHKMDTYSGRPRRYNYIVHPLAYRSSLNNIPDNGVDAMQWCILNIKKEANLGPYTPFGECHALEIFNDFTYVTNNNIVFLFNMARDHGHSIHRVFGIYFCHVSAQYNGFYNCCPHYQTIAKIFNL